MNYISESQYLEALSVIKQYEKQNIAQIASPSGLSTSLNCNKHLKDFIEKHHINSLDELWAYYQSKQMMTWAGFGKKLLIEVENTLREKGYPV